MSRRRVLTNEQETALEFWYSHFERARSEIGTVDSKCRELGISEDAFRDAIRRVRKQDVRSTKRKLSEAELNQLLDDIPRGTTEVV